MFTLEKNACVKIRQYLLIKYFKRRLLLVRLYQHCSYGLTVHRQHLS
jgi:hypothetical protein